MIRRELQDDNRANASIGDGRVEGLAMSYVSISKTVLDRIVQAACETRTEIIGFLLGRLEDDTIVIEDSTTHEFSSEPHHVMMPASSIAVIADKIVSGRLKGNIVGWYHSHTAGGLFFSDTDIATQKRLQQFSSLVTGIVVDASNGDVGYFRVTPGTNNAIRLADANIRVYSDPKDAVQRQAPENPPITATPTVEVRRRPPMSAPSRRVVLALTFVVLVVSIGVFTAVLYTYRNPPPQTVNISLVPISVATIGTPTQIFANVTGNGRNVTLVYGESAAGPPNNEATMKPVAAGEYAYTIPGGEITGNIAYYVKAYNSGGIEVNTPTYHIAVADFNLQSQTKAFTVYRTRSQSLNVQLLSINNFDENLKLSTSGNPTGLTVSYSANPATPGTAVNLNFTANTNAPNGTYQVTITATYTPPQSTPVTRQAMVDVTVADFQATIMPATLTVNPGATATYTITLTLQKGFVDPVSMAQITGLPPDATYELVANNPTILAGPGTTSVNLQIKVPPTTKAGTYTISIALTGGGVIHTLTTQIIVR